MTPGHQGVLVLDLMLRVIVSSGHYGAGVTVRTVS